MQFIEKNTLTRKLRAKLEWHFKNYKCDLTIFKEQRQDILDSGMTLTHSLFSSRHTISDPTAKKANALMELDKRLENQRSWFCVIRNTFLTYRHHPSHDVMVELYINGKSRSEIIDGLFSQGLWETTFWRWRDNWLETAYKWAKEFELL